MLSSKQSAQWKHQRVTKPGQEAAGINRNIFAESPGDPLGYWENGSVYVVYRGVDNKVWQLSMAENTLEWTASDLFPTTTKTENEGGADNKTASSKSKGKDTQEHDNKAEVTTAVSPKSKAKVKHTLAPTERLRNIKDMLPANDSLSPEDRSKKRHQIVRELLVTEENYVAGLKTVVEVMVQCFQNEFRQVWMEPLFKLDILSVEKIATIFGTLEKLLKHHEVFLKAMRLRVDNWSEEQKIGDLFINQADFLVQYTNYVNAFSKIQDLIQESMQDPRFAQYVAVRNSPCSTHSTEM